MGSKILSSSYALFSFFSVVSLCGNLFELYSKWIAPKNTRTELQIVIGLTESTYTYARTQIQTQAETPEGSNIRYKTSGVSTEAFLK